MRTLAIIASSLLLLASCGSSDFYRPTQAVKKPQQSPVTSLEFDALLYHLDKDKSVVIVRIPMSSLLSKIDPTTQQHNKRMRVVITAKESGKNQTLATDTSFLEFKGSSIEEPYAMLLDTMAIHTVGMGERQRLLVEVSDENKRSISRRAYIFIKDGKPREDYFLVVDGMGQPIFPNDGTPDNSHVRSDVFAQDTLRLHHFRELGKVALPPFSTREETPNFASADSVLPVSFDSEHSFLLVDFSGSILISNDTSFPVGLSVNKFSEDFPGITNHMEMARTLRYITDRDEYSRLTDTANDTRAEVEKFWLARTKYRENARRLIREYYARVRYANEHFSSYKEGWKTDRGMIHIVFGPPTRRDQYDDREIWTYGDGYRVGSVSFTFYQREYSISKNDMELMRNPVYRTHWNVAVEEWRYGRVKTQ